MPVPDIEILLPVHNEAESIGATVREIYDELSPRLKIGFIIYEDGSKDNTRDILTNLCTPFSALRYPYAFNP